MLQRINGHGILIALVVTVTFYTAFKKHISHEEDTLEKMMTIY